MIRPHLEPQSKTVLKGNISPTKKQEKLNLMGNDTTTNTKIWESTNTTTAEAQFNHHLPVNTYGHIHLQNVQSLPGGSRNKATFDW